MYPSHGIQRCRATNNVGAFFLGRVITQAIVPRCSKRTMFVFESTLNRRVDERYNGIIYIRINSKVVIDRDLSRNRNR